MRSIYLRITLPFLFLFSTVSYAQQGEIRKIILYLQKGQIDLAKTNADQLKKYPTYSASAEQHYYYGKAMSEYVRSKDREKQDQYETWVLDAEKAFRQCDSLDKEGKFTAQVLTRLDNLSTIVMNKAAVYYHEKKYEMALKLFKISLKLDPPKGDSHTKTMRLAAVCAQNLGNNKEAKDMFVEMVKKEKQELNVYKRIVQLGKALKESNEQQAANIELGIKAYPKEKYFLMQQAILLGENPQADPLTIIRLYTQVLEIDPQDPTASYNLGVIYYNNGAISQNNNKPDEAKKFWNKALPLWETAYKQDPEVKSDLKELYMKLGMKEKAEGLE